MSKTTPTSMVDYQLDVFECGSDDLHLIVPLLDQFHAESGHNVVADFDAEVWLRSMQSLVDHGMARVTYTQRDRVPVAFMAAYISANLFNGDIQVQEQAWYVQKACRTDPDAWMLMRELEEWSASIGARRILVTHLNNKTGDRLRSILPRFGYQPLELYYAKELN